MNVIKGLLALGLMCWVIAALRQEKADAVKIQEPGQASGSELPEPESPQKLIKVFREDKTLLVPWSKKAVPYALK